ncbi:MAG: PD-(D/E)XK nuclease family protein [Bdellovibrionaceae bacterium]|nr:PD-(D/E)XK nuclease family protein [Pseudobdellovibrionaceae bacterium]
MITLSHSSVSVFLDCPRCFWLKVHRRLRLPEIVRSNIPNVVDKMLKEVYDVYRDKGVPMEFELAENRKLEVKLVDKKTHNRLSDISFEMELEGVKFKFVAMLDDCAIQDYGEGPILIPLDHQDDWLVQ